MQLDELKEGEIYKCRLSDNEMLVVSTKKVVNEGTEAEATETIKAGKYTVEQNGITNFVYDELYNGQLEELTK